MTAPGKQTGYLKFKISSIEVMSLHEIFMSTQSDTLNTLGLLLGEYFKTRFKLLSSLNSGINSMESLPKIDKVIS